MTDKEIVNNLAEPEDDNSDNSGSTMAALVRHFRKNPGALYKVNLSGGITPTGSVKTQVIRPETIPSEEKFGIPTIGFADVGWSTPFELIWLERPQSITVL